MSFRGVSGLPSTSRKNAKRFGKKPCQPKYHTFSISYYMMSRLLFESFQVVKLFTMYLLLILVLGYHVLVIAEPYIPSGTTLQV